MSLTSQQEKFAQEVASGKSQSEAYRIAYPKSLMWKPDTVWKRSGEMMRNGAVMGRIDEIRAELSERGLWTREQSVKILAEIAQAGEKDSERVSAIKELNSMHGFEAAKEIKHSGGMPVTLIVQGVKPDA